MGIPTLELHPGVGLGPFTLGSPLCDALAEVERQHSLFESTAIKYSEQDPLSWDIVVAFPHLGFHLCFHPRHQRLYKLEVYDITRVHLRYANSIIGGPSTPATFARIYSVLGPTFPGRYQQELGTYTLSYPGLSLLFRIPSRYANCCMQCKELPLEFPDGTTPVVSRISLHLGDLPAGPGPREPPAHRGALTGAPLGPHPRQGLGPGKEGIQGIPPSSLQRSAAPLPPLPPLVLPHGALYMEEVHVRLGSSIYFTASQQEVPFGASPQDVWSELGRPCSIVHREGETMLIHLPPPSQHQPHQQQQQQQQQQHQQQQLLQQEQLLLHSSAPGGGGTGAAGDFAWSYFTRGIDVVFDAETRTVKKLVLHTNAPGHPDFNEYVKCNFVIVPGASGSSPSASGPLVTADSKWDEAQRVLGCGGQAAIQTSGSLHIAFGPTFVYGHRGATFEVMRNGHISTVTLFRTDC